MEHKIAYKLGKKGKPFDEKLIDPIYTNKIELIENGKVCKTYNTLEDILTEKNLDRQYKGNLVTSISMGNRFKGSLYRVSRYKSKSCDNDEKPLFIKTKDGNLLKIIDTVEAKFYTGLYIGTLKNRLNKLKNRSVIYLSKSQTFVSFNLKDVNMSNRSLIKKYLKPIALKVTYHDTNEIKIVRSSSFIKAFTEANLYRNNKVEQNLMKNKKHFMKIHNVTLEIIDE